MKSKLEVKKEIAKTISDATEILLYLQNKLEKEKAKDYSFHLEYQKWYSKALKIVETFGKERLNDFKSHYEIDSKRKVLGYGTYVIQDYLKNIAPNSQRFPAFDSQNETLTNFYNQYTILVSIFERFDSTLADIQTTLLYEIQETELSNAKTLLKINLRASGVLAGVILESHLEKVISNHNIKIAKKNPTLSDYNENLKNNDIIDTTTWKKILYLSDIRNLCAHKKEREPNMTEVQELLDGVNWTLKNLY
ncbi:hypothetical protein [Flavobacterium sp. GCM10023249]|uniref:hypothetical protein n=1 Tax=unclassified Flavobacterium TaxID=196869 RepID=UPI00360F7236